MIDGDGDAVADLVLFPWRATDQPRAMNRRVRYLRRLTELVLYACAELSKPHAIARRCVARTRTTNLPLSITTKPQLIDRVEIATKRATCF